MAKRNKIHSVFTIIAILLIIGIFVYSLLGNNKKRDIVGAWVTTIDGKEQGFQCGTQGLAASINNDTCQYNNWELAGGNLLLKGKAFRDGSVLTICDTLKILKLNPNTLTVKNKDAKTTYTKL